MSAPIRVYLPMTFINDAKESDPEMWHLWEKIINLPEARRGRGKGRWAELSEDEARAILAEATYRREYWLTDAYGPDDIQPWERTAGKAAERVESALRDALT